MPTQPALLDTLTELPRAGIEATRLTISLRRLYRGIPRGDGHPVLVLPAYGVGNLGLWPLRRSLKGLGYDALASGMELNLDRGELRIRRVEDADGQESESRRLEHGWTSRSTRRGAHPIPFGES